MAAAEQRVVLLYIGEHRKKIAFCGCTLGNLIKTVRQNYQLDSLIPAQEGILYQIWDEDFQEFVDLDDNNSDVPNKSKIKVIKIKDPHPISPPPKTALNQKSLCLEAYSSEDHSSVSMVSNKALSEASSSDVNLINSNNGMLLSQSGLLIGQQLPILSLHQPVTSLNTNEAVVTDYSNMTIDIESEPTNSDTNLINSSKNFNSKWKSDIYELPKFSPAIQEILLRKEFPSEMDRRVVIDEIKNITKLGRYPDQYYYFLFWNMVNKFPHLRDSSETGYLIWLNELNNKFCYEGKQLDTVKDCQKSKESITKIKRKLKEAECSQTDERKKDQQLQIINVLSTSNDRCKNTINYKLPEFSNYIIDALKTGQKPTKKIKRGIISQLFQDLLRYSWYPNKLYPQVFDELYKKYPHLKTCQGPSNTWVADLRMKFANERRKLTEDFRQRAKVLSKSFTDIPEETKLDEVTSDKEDSKSQTSTECSENTNEKWNMEPMNSPSVSTTSNQVVPVETSLSIKEEEDDDDDDDEEPMAVDSQTQLFSSYQLPQFSCRLEKVLNGEESLTRKHKRWIVDEIFINLSQFTWYPQNYKDIVSSLLTMYPHLEIDGISFNTWLHDLKMKFANERRKLNKIDLID